MARKNRTSLGITKDTKYRLIEEKGRQKKDTFDELIRFLLGDED